MKAARTSAAVGRLDGGGIKQLESNLQHLLSSASAPSPPAARHTPRSTLAGLLSHGLDAAAAPGVQLLTYRIMAQNKALAPHVNAAPELMARLVAAALSEVGAEKEEGNRHDGKENEEDEEEGTEENDDVGVWAIRALLSNVRDAHLVVLLR